MHLHMHLCKHALFSFIVVTTAVVEALDLCHIGDTNVTFYAYKNRKSQNCSCVGDFCVSKCCALGFSAKKGLCARPPPGRGAEPFSVPLHRGREPVRAYVPAAERRGLAVGVMDCGFFGAYIPKLEPAADQFYVQEDGSIWTPALGRLDNSQYCVDDLLPNLGLAAFVCSQSNLQQEILESVNNFGMIVSMPFLLATFVVYALLPDRNLHMKALMSYVINLFGGYLLLVCIQLSKLKFSYPTCVMLGYLCLFFFMVSFFWMNVICIDIWFAFSGLRGFSGTKNAERRRFLFYCLYAWGMSIVHVLTVFTIDKLANRKSWYYPSIGNGQCFLQLGWAELLYFYGPMGTLITINIILFAITAIRIRKLRQETSMLKKDDNKRHTYENDKQKFNLYLKLLFAMGVNWSMELISWAVTWRVGHVPPYIWYLTDFCNAIYGVFIFFIFVFKRSIWKLLKKRYYSFIGKPYLAHSMTQNQTSRVTSYSTANTSVPEEHPQSHGESIAMTEA